MSEDGKGPAVLVAGSRRDLTPNAIEFDEFCADLGRQMAAQHFTIIAGSIKPSTADFHVLRGAGHSERPANVRFIRPVAGAGDVPFEAQLEEFGRFAARHELYPGDWSDVRSRQVTPADVVVLLGGSEGTLTIAAEAERQSKPIIPVPNFGGAAQSVLQKLGGSPRWQDTWGLEYWGRFQAATHPAAIVEIIRDWWKHRTAGRPALREEAEGSTADIGIICPLEEELQAVLRRIPTSMWRLDPPRPDYVQAFYTAEVGDCRLAIASPTKMGRVHAAVTTADLIRRFSPRFVLLVGIAGGNRAEGVALGDIIVSDQIIDYELQRLQPGKPEIRQQAYAVHQRLLSEAQALLGWEAKIEVKRPGKGAVKRRVGPTLCGDKVIAIGSVLRTLGLQFPKVIAVEMEGAGCALACLRFDAGPGFLMIRGVSDLADEKKQTSAVVQWRPYASDAAAGFAMHLLHRILPRRNGRDR